MKEMLYKDICYSFSNYLCVELYRHNLDDPLPPVHSQPVQVPLEGDLDYSYATITGSGHTRNTLETDESRITIKAKTTTLAIRGTDTP